MGLKESNKQTNKIVESSGWPLSFAQRHIAQTNPYLTHDFVVIILIVIVCSLEVHSSVLNVL